MAQTTLERDARDLAALGYRQRLDRTLGGFSAFAAGFSYLSVFTGSSQLFHVGYAAGGPAFFWTWPAVFLGQFLVALVFAELAGRYPLAGGVYPWAKMVGSDAVGWTAGWVYLACSVITLASVALALQTTLPQLSPWFQVVGRADVPADAAKNAVVLAVALVALSTWVNAAGLRLLARINNVGVFVEMIGVVALIGLLAAAARRGPGVVFDTAGHGAGQPLGYLGPALAASLMASFVLYGFDTAGTLAEETDDPRRRAPRAILWSLASVGLAGSLLVFTAVRAAPDLAAPALSSGSGGLPYVVKAALGSALGGPFLAVMAFAIVVCTFTVQAASVRLLFAMARDNHLPFARSLAKVHEGYRTPTLPAVVVGLLAVGLLLLNAGEPRLIEVMTSVAVVWANLAYLFVTVPRLLRRLSGRPLPAGDGDDPGGARPSRFAHDGPLGLAVNAAAVAWGVAVVVNIGWPRPSVYGDGLFGRYGAAPATAVMLATGLAYDRFFRRHRSGTLDEHRP